MSEGKVEKPITFDKTIDKGKEGLPIKSDLDEVMEELGIPQRDDPLKEFGRQIRKGEDYKPSPSKLREALQHESPAEGNE